MAKRATVTDKKRQQAPKRPRVGMTARSIADVYARLYHYTTLQGVFGILETKQLWATHCRFLNDYSEIVLFRDRLIEFLRPHVLQEYKTLVSENQQAKDALAAHGDLDAVVKHDAAAVHDPEYLLAASESGESLRPEKERKFRDGRSRHIPYIEMFASLDTPLPIERIIVGPHKDKESRASALRVMLRNTDIQVTVSDIPYVC